MTQRLAVLTDLALRIEGLRISHPLRVAVDGRTASGKTTLADELAVLLRDRKRHVIRTSIDGFHSPRAVRYARGRQSAEGYYYDARDLPAINTLLLMPLGPGGDRHYRTASFDLDNDVPITQASQVAPADAVLIVDGTFLQRPELRDNWDVTIFVDTTADISEQRGISRDLPQLGGAEATRQLYANRYRPAFDLYDHLSNPALAADAVLDNNDLDQPRLTVRLGGRLASKQ